MAPVPADTWEVRLVVTAVLAALLAAAGLATAPPADAADQSQRYLVQLRPGVDADRVVERSVGDLNSVRRELTALPAVVVSVPAAAADRLAGDPDVLRVEPDGDATVAADLPWGLDRIDQRALPLDGAYGAPGAGGGVRVYVVDTGILATHADLVGRVDTGVRVLDGRLTADGRGDCNGHGTHVAGIAGGTRLGVAPGVRLVPVQVMDCEGGGQLSDVLTGLDWVLAHHPPGAPGLVNLSLAGNPSAVVDDAVRALHDAGLVVVVAAGNDSADACATSPAREPAAITVGATDATDTRAPFSNRGPCLDLFAPGDDIPSAWSTSDTAVRVSDGTSMAAPHVTGILAQYLGAEPRLTPAQLTTRLLSSATPDVVRSAGVGSPRLLAWAGTVAESESPAEPGPVEPVAQPSLEPVPEPAPEPAPLPFRDVPEDAYYAEPVRWAVDSDVTSGTTATTFSPGTVVRRAEAVTFLWRAVGRPAPDAGAAAFTDVPAGAYYADAVAWAVEEGITTGRGAGRFAPGDPVTREQAVTFLWRLLGEPKANPSTFTDVPPDGFAAGAIAWAQHTGITSGTSPTTFSPTRSVIRADMVTLLHATLVE